MPFVSLSDFKKKLSGIQQREFRNLQHKYTLLPQRLSYPFKLFSSPLQADSFFNAIGMTQVGKTGLGQAAWLCQKESIPKGKFLLTSRIPWVFWAGSGLHMQPESPGNASEPPRSSAGCGQGARSSPAPSIFDVFLHSLPPLRDSKP